MNIEGMGHKKLSRAAVNEEISEGIEDFKFERHQRNAADLIKLARPIDARDKALTGRKIEDYELDSGIDRTELFPDGSKILNIGDPWQTLDKEGVTTLEYETGEEAAFVTDENYFFSTLENSAEEIDNEIDFLANRKPDLAGAMRGKLAPLLGLEKEDIALDDYPKFGRLAQELADGLASFVPELYDRLPDAWYAATHIARGFNDLHLLKTIIEPAIQQESVARNGLTAGEEAELRRQLIEEHRGGKKYKSSKLVKGAFPHTDFEEHSFDRIVASWSISAHMFAVMGKKHFDTTWKETDRLLNKDGAAYFWPLHFSSFSPKQILVSVDKYVQSGGAVGFTSPFYSGQIVWYNKENAPLIEKDWGAMNTLIVLGTNHGIGAIRRVEDNLLAGQTNIEDYEEQDVV